MERRADGRYGVVMRRLATSMIVAAALLGAAPLPTAAQEPARVVSVDFRDVPLDVLARWVSDTTGTNIVFAGDDLARRRLTVVAPRPVPIDEVLDLFIAGLWANGLRVEVRAHYVLVLPASS